MEERELLSVEEPAKVNLFIVGAQKAGTTALAHNLRKHPNVHIADGELQYFTRVLSGRQARDDDRYFRRVLGSRKETPLRYIGEKSPSYAVSPRALALLWDYNPDAKIFMCLRHPILRMYSRFADITKDEPERLHGKSFERIAKQSIKHANHWTQTSSYSRQIMAMKQIFPPENLTFLVQERMLAALPQSMQTIFEKLGLDPLPVPFDRVHTGQYKLDCDARILARLAKYFRARNENLTELLQFDLPEWAEIDAQLGCGPSFG